MYLILGAEGQLGRSFVTVIDRSGLAYIAPKEKNADVLDQQNLRRLVNMHKVQVVINCSGYTDVEGCSEDPKQVYDVNREAPRKIGIVCREFGISCVHFSTDYVFSGKVNQPYTEDDQPNPISEYGQSKYQGEEALLETKANCLIFRISWLYSPYGENNFYKTMCALAHKKTEIRVIFDQISTPTYAPYLAQHVLDILLQFKSDVHTGIYHLGDEGVASWYDFAYMLMHTEGLDARVLPILSCDYKSKTKRPFYSVLSKVKVKKTFRLHLNHWSEGVFACHQALKEIF